MMIALLVAAIVLAAASLALQVVLLRRASAAGGQDPASIAALASLGAAVGAVEAAVERGERAFRQDLAQHREEGSGQARQLRDEVGAKLKDGSDTLLRTLGELSTAQRGQLEAFGERLGKLTEASEQAGQRLRDEINLSLKRGSETNLAVLTEIAGQQRVHLDGVSASMAKLTESNQKQFETLRGLVDQKLKDIQQDNASRLDQMRQTVDEKLQGTLEKRLGESFKFVSERLEQVHKGLGEMQNLATGVGDLKRVLTNVKTRGTWGEIQLGALLEQFLSPDQFGMNICTRDGSSERVEFAIKLPGRGEAGDDQPLWLPIDSKFPQEDYHRLQQAQEQADPVLVEQCCRDLERGIRKCAKDIREKYINPPATTDFALLFLPTEGLYAEVVRRNGLCESLQRDYRITVAGPTTLAATVCAYQMGFRTLAIQKRSSEVWDVLGAVKTEFGKFGDTIGKVQKKLQEASNTIEDVGVRTRAIERKLRNVQELPASDAEALLGGSGPDIEEL